MEKSKTFQAQNFKKKLNILPEGSVEGDVDGLQLG